MNKTIIPVDIFKRGLCVIIDDVNELLAELLNDMSEQEARQIICDNKNADAFTIESGNDVIIYSHNPMPLQILVHELSHATSIILKQVGIEDEETYAYLLEYLFGECLNHPITCQSCGVP